jgi:glycosyltransferase involved in cell wall biosynthesis
VAGAGAPDVLLVSIAGTHGLLAADDELAASMRRAGARVMVARVRAAREPRTHALNDLAWSVSARRAALGAPRARAVLYSTVTAALLGPFPGAVCFDAPAAGNRPGRHGVWQRPAERRRLERATVLVPWSEGALAEAPRVSTPSVIVPVPVRASGAEPAGGRDIAAVTYGANPSKKGLDRVLAAWRSVRCDGEELVVAGLSGADEPGVRFAGALDRSAYRALVRRARAFVCAPRREDYGIAQLEALADGTPLVTSAAPGPYAALPVARALDPRLVAPDGDIAGLARALRLALDDPAPDYAERAAAALAPWSPAAVDTVVAERLLPLLLG